MIDIEWGCEFNYNETMSKKYKQFFYFVLVYIL